MSSPATSLHQFQLKADRIMVGMLAILLFACIGIAAGTGQWSAALIVGIPGALVPIVLLRTAPGAFVGRAAVAVSFMLFPALMIHLTRGMLEMHFGIFVTLAFLMAYCEWRLIVLAAGVIAVHHLGFNFLQAANTGVYVLPQAASMQVILVHAAYVVFEAAVLVYLAVLLRNMVESSAVVAQMAARIGAGDLREARTDTGRQNDELVGTVAAMQVHLRDMVGQIRANATEAGASIERIIADAERVGAVVGEISSALDEQSAAATDIARHVEQITSMTDGTASITAAVAREVEYLRGVAGALTTIVERFRT